MAVITCVHRTAKFSHSQKIAKSVMRSTEGRLMDPSSVSAFGRATFSHRGRRNPD
jgi:hypothetical protein